MDKRSRLRLTATGLALLIGGLASTAHADEPDERAQRLAIAARPGYDGYMLQAQQDGLLRQARTAWAAGKMDEALARLDELLAAMPVSIVGHLAMSEVLAKRSELATDPVDRIRWLADSKAHRETAERLVASIVQGTRCTSMDDDCKVINISEEYQVVRSIGPGTRTQQAVVISQNRVPFDALTIRDAAGATSVYYFDISPFFRGLQPLPAKP